MFEIKDREKRERGGVRERERDFGGREDRERHPVREKKRAMRE